MSFTNITELFGKHKTDAGQTRVNVSAAGNLATDSYLVDKNGEQIGIDVITRALMTVDYEHHEIHDGNHYFFTGFSLVGDAVELVFGVQTLNTNKWAHITTVITASSQVEILIYEDSVFTGGTPVPTFNNNRNSLNTSDVTLLGAPTVTDLGTLLSAQAAGKAGVNPQSARGGVVSRVNEVILKANTNYIFKTISRDDDNLISYRADWYEHTNKT